jgi:hypothetical protein
MRPQNWLLLSSLILLLPESACATNIVVHDPAAKQQDVSQTMQRPEARAIDTWLRQQGYNPLDPSEAITGTVDAGLDVQIPYSNGVPQRRAVLERIEQQGQDVFGAMIYWQASDGSSVVGQTYLYDRHTKSMTPTDELAPGGGSMNRPNLQESFSQYLACVVGFSFGTAIGSFWCLPEGGWVGYASCFGMGETTTLIGCGFTFWYTWLFS